MLRHDRVSLRCGVEETEMRPATKTHLKGVTPFENGARFRWENRIASFRVVRYHAHSQTTQEMARKEKRGPRLEPAGLRPGLPRHRAPSSLGRLCPPNPAPEGPSPMSPQQRASLIRERFALTQGWRQWRPPLWAGGRPKRSPVGPRVGNPKADFLGVASLRTDGVMGWVSLEYFRKGIANEKKDRAF